MKKIPICLILILVTFFSVAYGEEGPETKAKNELIVSDEEKIILFSTAILIVIGIIIYMNKNIILRKKTAYDKGEFFSQKNRDYEKYHSDWSDDYEKFGSKSSEDNETFRKAANESSLPNYYEIFGLEKSATQDEIKQRFRKLAKELHPDKKKDKDAENKMTKINKAYEILSDPERRTQYDKYLKVS